MHTELQWTGSVEQVRPVERNLNELTFSEPVAALEEQAGASHIGEVPAAVLPGFQCVLELQSERETPLHAAVFSGDGARMREVSPV